MVIRHVVINCQAVSGLVGLEKIDSPRLIGYTRGVDTQHKNCVLAAELTRNGNRRNRIVGDQLISLEKLTHMDRRCRIETGILWILCAKIDCDIAVGGCSWIVARKFAAVNQGAAWRCHRIATRRQSAEPERGDVRRPVVVAVAASIKKAEILSAHQRRSGNRTRRLGKADCARTGPE